MSSSVSVFLKHGGLIICEVTGRRKRSVTPGKGLEVPCQYTFKRQTCPHQQTPQGAQGAHSKEVQLSTVPTINNRLF